MTRSRKWVASTVILALILGLLAGFSTFGAVDTTITVTTDPVSVFVVGQSVEVTWTLTAQTASTVAFDGVLSVRIKSPGAATWDVFTDNVTTSGSGESFFTFSSNHTFTPAKAGDYIIDGNYEGCGTCDPVLLNASSVAPNTTISVSKAETTVGVTSDKNDDSPPAIKPVTGEAVTLTATVGINPACTTCTTPTGTVTFYANKPAAGSIGTVAVSGAGTADFTTSFNAVDHPVSVTAKYNGDDDYNESPVSSAISQNVYQANTTVAITSVPPSATVVGQNYTVSGTVTVVSPGSGTPTGTVVLAVNDSGGTASYSATLQPDGSWSGTLKSNTAGSKTITATYSGDTNYSAPTTAPTTTHTVNPAATTTTVSSSVNPSVTGQGVKFTATVVSVAPGSGTPANGTTVTFDVAGTPYSATLSGGKATTTPPIANLEASGSPYTVTATFDPGDPDPLTDPNTDPNYNTSTSAAFTQNVNKANTTTLIESIAPATTVVGQSYTTISGRVSVVLPGTGTPSAAPTAGGTVEVSDGTDTVTGIALTWYTDHWNWTTSSFVSTTAGAKTITATYSDSSDTKYQPSSDTDSHTVNKASTTVVITSALTAHTVVGQSYTVSGKVTPTDNTTGTHTTSGTVQVSDGTDTCTDATLEWNDSGYWDWSCPYSPAELLLNNPLISTTAGEKTITATYLGDANYSSDTTDTGVAHTVDPADTTVTITGTDLEAATDVGVSYTVSGTVKVDLPGHAMPAAAPTTTGTVQVSDGTDTCTTAALTWDTTNEWWTWSCSLTSTTAGNPNPKTLTATFDPTETGTYVGADANYYKSSDDTGSHTVNQASTTVEITGEALDTATVVGETYTVSGRVTPANTAGTHTTTGTVSVSDDGTPVCTCTDDTLTWSVDHWEWSCSLTSTTAGSKTLTATYFADTNYSGNSDTDDTHTVNQANTTTTVSSSVNPSVTGEGVTFTATVAPVAPGSETPATGTTVTFDVKDKTSTDISGSPFSGSLSGDQAITSPPIENLEASGSPYTVTATFNPATGTPPPTNDDNYNSSSGTLTQNVNKASTTVSFVVVPPATVVDDPDPSIVGQSYNVTGTLEGPPSDIPPTGTVQISDGTKNNSTSSFTWNDPVDDKWNWSVSLTSTTAGGKTLTATYSGDDNYGGSSNNTESHTVNKASTTTSKPSDSPATSITGTSYEVTGTVSVTSPGNLPLTGGSVLVYDGMDQYPATLTLSDGAWTCDFVSTTPGIKNLTAKYFGDANFNESPLSVVESHTVTDLSIPVPTSLEILGPGTACPWEPILLLARVTHPQTPGLTNFDGCVTWDVGGSDVETFESTCLCDDGQCSGASDHDACCAVSPVGECSVYYTPDDDIGTITITAQYVKDSSYESSNYANTFLYVVKRSTSTTVLGSDTPLVVSDTATFTVMVQDTTSATPCASCVPVGDVTITVDPAGAGTLGGDALTGNTHTLLSSEGGIFTFTYKPDSTALTPHTVTATYTGSTTHNGSAGSFDQAIIGRRSDIEMSVAPTSAYVYQPVTIAIHVKDATTAGELPPPGFIPTGKVTLAVDDGSGTFDHGEYTLDGNGNCTAVYSPDRLFDDGTDDYTNPLKTITATYSDPSNVHAGTSTVGHLNVMLRPTTTTVTFDTTKGILVNETTHFNVTVEDAAGVPLSPAANDLDGTIGITKSLEPKSEGHITELGGYWPIKGPAQSKWRYDYWRTALDAEGGDNDTITATYTPNDGIHTGSNGAYGKSISRRPTVTTITNEEATATGIKYDIQVAEDTNNNGTSSDPAGKFVEKGGTSLDEELVGPVPPLSYTGIAKTVDDPGHTLLVNVTVHYVPNDRVHLTSVDSETVDRSALIDEEDPTDPSNDGSDCTDGCGDGGTNVDQIIFNMNAAVVALHATQMGLDAGTIIASLFPNPVVTVGIIFESGAEIPAKDIVIAVLDGANLLLEVAIMAMETDLDGDGLPDTVENTITHTKYNVVDSDGDAMSDSDEIGYCAGYYGGTLRPNPNIPDSDGDGLMDGYELAPFCTDVCVTDSDCDTLPDGVEVACRTAPTADNGFDTTTFAALGYTYTFPDDFNDTRDQSNPREMDTDGDGLPDGIEFGPGVIVDLSSTTPHTDSYSPYVNDADSDGDGILDGNESTNGDAIWDYTQIGGTGTTGYGETHLCLADTDGDGLLDGEEETLFGRGGIEVHSTLGTITTPALDDDSDDDGLSDYEEQVVTNTDPLNWDSDDDGISDADELIATSGSWPTRSFIQSSDPLDPDTDDDGLTDYIEYGNNGVGTGLGTLYARTAPAGDPDTDCPLVNDDDSDNDGLQDGTESWDGNGTITTGTIGNSILQADTEPSGETYFCNPDTDGDGLTDGEEVALLGGLPENGSVAGIGFKSVYPKGVSTIFGTDGAVLDPTIPALDDDSDNDGLSDYEEVNITHTDPLDQDSDNDTLSDANELIATGGDWPNRTFIQESDPLDPDTDDDDLYDQIEYPGSGLGTTRGTDGPPTGGTPDNICPYVNDDDSDDDGLQDGYEDDDHDGVVDSTDHDGIWNNYTLGNSGSAGSGETAACNPDTDRDGLSDGEEEGLIARSSTWQLRSTEFGVAGVASAGSTVPALDDDSDNDGLSDYEEVDITHTDPLDADSDDDTLSDANELIATGYLSLDHPYTGYDLAFVPRQFQQESDPLDPDTDDDDLFDYIEYPGSGLGTSRTTGGNRDNDCPYVNDADSDDDGLQDGTEDANHDGTWGVLGSGITVGSFASQAARASATTYWETNLCNPDTDGDGLLDGEEVALIGGGPTMTSRTGTNGDVPVRAEWGFDTVTPERVSTKLPDGNTYPVPAGYTAASPIPGTTTDTGIGPYTFVPEAGDAMTGYETIPALDVDSDNDGLSDYEEVNITGTDPLDQDTDNDTLMDADELIATGGLEDTPGNPGIGPRRTFDQESDPLDINTDDDHLFDPQEYYYEGQYGSGLSAAAGGLNGSGIRDEHCPYVNDDDSDDDSIQDGARVTVTPAGVITSIGVQYTYTHYEDFIDLEPADVPLPPGIVRIVPTSGYGEQQNESLVDVCDPDSDGDGLNDGEEIAIGTNPNDWDTDDDGRNDWSEVTGGGGDGAIPTDPFDPDTDDDGLLDSAEVFGPNRTNPVNADTDGDGLCDGGTRTPWMTEVTLDARVLVNPICKSCSTPGTTPCATPLSRLGSPDGIGDHPNPLGIGEDEDGWGDWSSGETDPNQYDTDGDAIADGIERLSFSSTRRQMIPPTDIFGRAIKVVYPEANNVKSVCGCLDPLDPDSDDDGLSDGYEDRNHDGNFDFLPSEFDHQDPLPGPPIPYPTETNPCDDDTDHDGLTDWEERNQRQPLAEHFDPLPIDQDGDGAFDEDPKDGIDNDLDGKVDEDWTEEPIELTFNPTNPLDHDTDNDRMEDGLEVYWSCTRITYAQLDNDGDAQIDEDPIDLLDNDGDGLFDEDPVDFFVRFVPMLDPTNRDSDSDGFIDGLDDDPCNSELIPLLPEVQLEPIDTDGDGFSDDDEIVAGTHPNDPEDYPTAYCKIDLDFDQEIDDRLWLEPTLCCGIANSVAIDIDSNVLIDARVRIIAPRDVKKGDFDGDGSEDDYRYVVEYAFGNYRVVQPRILLTIDDYNGDLTIDHAEVVKK